MDKTSNHTLNNEICIQAMLFAAANAERRTAKYFQLYDEKLTELCRLHNIKL